MQNPLTAGLMSNLGVRSSQHAESTAIVGFHEQDYCYRSVATEIPHNATLPLILYTGKKFFLQ